MPVRLKNQCSKSEHGRKLSTDTFKKDMIHIYKGITPFFKKMAIKKIKPLTILNFQNDAQSKLKPQTVNQVVNCLGRILSFVCLRS